VAVLLFENIGGDPESEYFSAGITEDIIAHLSKNPDIKVVRALQYTGSATSMREVGRDLGVNTVLGGSVRQAGDDVRVVAQLIDTETEENLWAETYDRKLHNIFAIQTDIARNITEAMGIVLVAEAGSAGPPTRDLEAYQLYLRGRFSRSQRTYDGVTRSVDFFEQAIALDSTFAEAYAGLAETWVLMSSYTGATPDESLQRVLQAADRALELDPDLAGAYAARGMVLGWVARDFDGGIEELRRAVEANPGYAKAHHWLGISLVALGRLDEGLAELERAAELEPLSLIIHAELAWMAFFAGRRDQAVAEFDKTIELDPRFPKPYLGSAEMYGLMGRHELEAERLERWNALLDVPAYRPGSIEEAFRAGGADAMYRVLLQPSIPRTAEHAYHRVGWLVALGEIDAAIDALEEEVAARRYASVMLNVSPSFESLRGNPRFEALVEEVFGRAVRR
ncbi:MAG: tetratricopeptide repeat protein, partial [Gemmatimonadales bacterium]